MDKVIHIGAGQGTELPGYIAAGAREIILIEPLPTLASALKHKAATITDEAINIQVLEAAVTADSSKSLLREFNLPGTASLREPQGLKALYPGLKTIAQHSVQVITVRELVDHYGPTEGETALLVIEAPGEALALIQSLAEADLLKRFQEVQFTDNPEPFYADSGKTEEVLTQLEQHGFEQIELDDSNPDWPIFRLARNPLKDTIAMLEQQLAGLKNQLLETQQQLADVERQKAYAHKETEAAQARADASEQKLVATEAELKQQLADVEQQKADAHKAAKAAQARANASEQKLAATEAKLKQQLAAAEQQLAVAEKATATENARAHELEQLLTHAEATCSSKEQAEQQAIKQLEQLKIEQLLPAQEALAKEQAAHKQTAAALEEAKKAAANKEQALTKATQQLEEARQTQQQTEKSLEDNKKWFQARKQQAEQQQTELAELKKQNEDLQQQLKQQTEALKQVRQELANEAERRAEQQSTNVKLDELEKKIASLGSNLTNHIDKKLTSTAKQVEDTLGLQNYLNTGELPLNYHGWPISTDLALYLTERLETQNYDLVIEFGSGTSTVLLAKVLMKKMQRQNIAEGQKRIGTERTSQSTETWLQETSLPNETDLPKRVLTFEHSEHYHQQTAAMLRQAGLDQVVDLVHAPLVDYSYQGSDYLYYDCDKTLAKIAELYEGRQPNILVLVDGPPGATGPNARFPALPKLLNYLSKAKFDVILDDYHRAEEKSVADKWIDLLEKRSKNYTEAKIPLEKGAIFITVR